MNPFSDIVSTCFDVEPWAAVVGSASFHLAMSAQGYNIHCDELILPLSISIKPILYLVGTA